MTILIGDDDDDAGNGDDDDNGNDDYEENGEHQIEAPKPHCDQNSGRKELYQKSPGNQIIRKLLPMKLSGKFFQ